MLFSASATDTELESVFWIAKEMVCSSCCPLPYIRKMFKKKKDSLMRFETRQPHVEQKCSLIVSVAHQQLGQP